MSLTNSNTKNTVTKPILASSKKLLREQNSGTTDRRLILTGNKVFPKKISKSSHNPFLTSPQLFERDDNDKHLTDSWQKCGKNSWQVDYKRADKWFKNGSPANTRKERHTQLTRANYYDFNKDTHEL